MQLIHKKSLSFIVNEHMSDEINIFFK